MVGSRVNDFTKNERFKKHLRIAENNGISEEVLTYLHGLSECEWQVSEGNLKPNEPDYLALIEVDTSKDKY